MANETPNTPERLAFVSNLAAHVRQLDPSRLVTAALLPEAEDPLIPHLDVVGLNEYFGWYYGEPEGVEPLLQRLRSYHKPIIISEFGADCVAGMRGASNERRTEESQADFYRRQFAMVSRFPSVAGTSPWVLYDFRSPLRQNKYQRGYNRKGLIADDHRTHKLAFNAVREIYAGLRRTSQRGR